MISSLDRLTEQIDKAGLTYDERVMRCCNFLKLQNDKDIEGILSLYIEKKKNNSVPEQEQVQGEISQGTFNNLDYRVPLKLFSRGKLILGSLGTGKTTDAYQDIIALRKFNIPEVIIDFRGDYEPLSNYLDGAFIHATDLRINPADIADKIIKKDVWRNFSTGIICDCLNLHEASLLLLRDNVIEVENKIDNYTLFDLIAHLEEKSKKSFGKMREKYDTLNTKIKGFINGMGNILDCQESMPVDEIFNYGLVVINMVGLSIIEKRFMFYYLLGSEILRSITRRERGDELKKVILVDESEQYLSIDNIRQTGKVPEIVTLINFCRDVGIGQIYIAHNISKLIDEVKQFGIVKTFRTQSLEDITEIANCMNIEWSKRGILPSLKQKESLISTAIFPNAVLLKSPDFIIDKKVDEDKIKISREKFLEKVKYIPLKEPKINLDNPVKKLDVSIDNSLTAEDIMFLMDIKKNPWEKITKRYENLKMSIDKGNKIKTKLINNGFLTVKEINTFKRGGTFKALSLTQKAYDILKIPQEHNGRGSIEHQYRTREIGNSYAKNYNVKIEYPISSNGECIDVFAWNDNERIGIELELSTGHGIENIRKCLLFNCTKVVSVSKDEKIMEKIKEKALQEFKEEINKIEFKLLKEFK